MCTADAKPGYALSRWLFLRLLAVVYLAAFGSLAVQITGLIGERGLLPAGAFLDWAHSIYGRDAYRLLPTIFWLGTGNTAIALTAWGGVALSVLLLTGLAPALVLGLLWTLYLSLSVAGQTSSRSSGMPSCSRPGCSRYFGHLQDGVPAAERRHPRARSAFCSCSCSSS